MKKYVAVSSFFVIHQRDWCFKQSSGIVLPIVLNVLSPVDCSFAGVLSFTSLYLKNDPVAVSIFPTALEGMSISCVYLWSSCLRSMMHCSLFRCDYCSVFSQLPRHIKHHRSGKAPICFPEKWESFFTKVTVRLQMLYLHAFIKLNNIKPSIDLWQEI